MTDLSYVHRSASARDGPSTAASQPSTGTSSEAQIEEELMQQATRKSAGERLAGEARRWKEEHEKMSNVAAELANKVASLKLTLEDTQGKHRNLQENHQAMQSKYRAIKEDLKGMRSTQDSETVLASDWRQKAAKWKTNCSNVTAKFQEFEAMVKEQSQRQSEEVARLTEKLEASKLALQRKTVRCDRLADELSQSSSRVSHEASKRSEALSSLHTQACVSDKHAQLNEDLREAHAREIERLKEQMAERDLEHEATMGELIEAQVCTEELQEEVTTQANRAARAERELRTSAEDLRELAQLRKDLPEVRSRLKERARLQEQLDSAERELKDSEAVKSKLQKELASSRAKLQDDLVSTRAELASTRAKLQADLTSTRAELASTRAKLQDDLGSKRAELASTRAKLQDDLERTKSELAVARAKLESASKVTSELAILKEEMPLVKDKMQAGKLAAKEAAQLRSDLADARSVQAELDASRSKLKAEFDASRSKLKSDLEAAKSELEAARSERDAARSKLKSELETAKSGQAKLKSELETAKSGQAKLKSELDDTKKAQPGLASAEERLRAATQTISEKVKVTTQLQKEVERLKGSTAQYAGAVKDCAHVLSGTELVLKACMELHAKSKDSPLSTALAETTVRVGKCLQSIPAL